MIDPGKRVTISLKNDRLTGTVLPRSDLQSKDTVTLKLDSGYNVGIATSRITDVTYHESTAKSQPVIDLRKKPGLPTVGVVSCGGTIVSRVDYSTGGVVAQSDPKFILSQSSLVGSLVNIGTVTAPVSKDSSQLEPDDWKLVAHDVHKQLVDESVSGVVVFSGTDSLHYLTAALSFMLKHINKPVVVVYSHRSTDRASTDSFGNIDAALRMTQSGICCVMAVGHATSQEGTYYALRGTTLRKMHTSRRDGFRPINDKPIAVMNSSGIVSQQQVPWNGQTPLLQDAFERKIGLIHYAPGMSPDILRWHIREGYTGIVISMLGLGQIAAHQSSNDWTDALQEAHKHGVVVCATAQTLYGQLQPNVYSPGRVLQETGVLYLKGMTSETAYVKLGCALGRWGSKSQVCTYMQTNLCGEPEFEEYEMFLR